MKLSIYTTITNPDKREDLWKEAVANYCDLADEVIIVNGGEKVEYDNPKVKIIDMPWPEDWEWDELALHMNRGLEACTGDWAIRMDIDTLFHENDFRRIRDFLETCIKPVVSFHSCNLILADLLYVKGKKPMAINKRTCGDKIKQGVIINEGSDENYPIIVEYCKNGIYYGTKPNYFASGINCYNYGYFFRTEKVAMEVWKRYMKPFCKLRGHAMPKTDEELMETFMAMMMGRYKKAKEKISLDRHPKHIREAVKNLRPEQFGYNYWDYKNE